MSRTVTFTVGSTSYNSETNFGLMLIGKSQDIPAPRIETVEIPGRNGVLDLSEYLTGSVQFEDFDVDMEFMFNSRVEATVKSNLATLCTAINGKTATVVLPGTFTYSGRCTVKNFTNDGQLWFVDVSLQVMTPANGKGFS